MAKRIFNIREFSNYLNISKGFKNEELHIVDFADQQDIRLKSAPVTIDFYLIAIKPPFDKRTTPANLQEDQAKSHMYADCPHNSLDWDITTPDAGYTILVSAKFLNKHIKDYSFMHYNNHEALFLSKEEETIVWDIFKKAHDEFQKEFYSREVITSYITLILSYTRIFYDRQFDTRSKIYHKVIADFYKNLEDFFTQNEHVAGLPSVAFFAQRSNLSPNYFGDLIKHFTGKSPIDHIHDYVLQLAKDKLKNTSLSVSEISYSLGFDYPNYFARFFRRKTGIAPRVFRNQ
ncbi:helix-turn-helix domain-containing protein [Chitinophaga varians]|uniref:helix-turn-helix domain-containing protein n=1 Tax=Chitinophaga varians TaxID=2202339 RepID=UPI00165F06DB|nr:helix-turn-helix domain-containing protein [Chitinophaga varians]MBC9914263.1 AraC family transcriptional regulator [Chitinophaga varians]